jgi:hypothetical protein
MDSLVYRRWDGQHGTRLVAKNATIRTAPIVSGKRGTLKTIMNTIYRPTSHMIVLAVKTPSKMSPTCSCEKDTADSDTNTLLSTTVGRVNIETFNSNYSLTLSRFREA